MAIAIDATSASTGVSSVSSVTYSHTVAAANEVIAVSIGARTNKANTNNIVSTVTYNGTSCTSQRADANITGDPDTFSGRTAIYTLINPSTGANNVVVTWTGTVTYGASGASSWTGVDQTTPVNAVGGATGASTTLSAGITTTVDNCYLIDAVYSRSGTLTKDATQTTIANVSIAGDDTVGASYKSAGATGAKTMDWIESADGNDWAISAIALAPASSVAVVRNGMMTASTRFWGT